MRPGTNDDDVEDHDDERDRNEQREARHDRLRDRAEIVGQDLPAPPAADDSQGHAEEERAHAHRRGLPGDRAGRLAAREAERLEQREIPAPAAHRGDERVGHRRGREEREHTGQQQRQRAHALVGDDVGGTLNVADLEVEHVARHRRERASAVDDASTGSTGRGTVRGSPRDRSWRRARRAPPGSRPRPRPTTSCPDPGYVASPGSTTRPTIRIERPDPFSGVTVTESPVPTPSARIDRAPSAISFPRCGSTPLTTVGPTARRPNADRGHGDAVHAQLAQGSRRPRGNIGRRVEQLADLVPDPRGQRRIVAAGAHAHVPVPAVEPRRADQMIETGGEHERGGDGRDGERGRHDRRAGGNGGPAPARFERHPHARADGERCAASPERARQPRRPRRRGRRRLPRPSARIATRGWPPARAPTRRRASAPRPNGETVDPQAGIGLGRAGGADRRERGRGDGEHDRDDRAADRNERGAAAFRRRRAGSGRSRARAAAESRRSRGSSGARALGRRGAGR